MTKPSQDKINDKLDMLEQALQRFVEAIEMDSSSNPVIIDGTIQRFEFCFELLWKTMKLLLDFEEIKVASPRLTLQKSLELNWIEDEPLWSSMLEARNDTTHEYNKEKALEIYKKLPHFVPVMRKTFDLLKEKYYILSD